MTAMPPEPDFRNLPPPPAFPPPVYPPPDQYAPRRRRAFSIVRIACGALWAAFTIILAAGTVMEWLTGLHAASIMCFVFAVGCGWYDYRIWTFKARRLWFLSEAAPAQRPILALPPRLPPRHHQIQAQGALSTTSLSQPCAPDDIAVTTTPLRVRLAQPARSRQRYPVAARRARANRLSCRSGSCPG